MTEKPAPIDVFEQIRRQQATPLISDAEYTAKRKGQDLGFRRAMFIAVMALMLFEVACMIAVISPADSIPKRNTG